MNKLRLIKIVSAIAVVVISMVYATPAEASVKCFSQYGGETCINIKKDADIEVDKKIYNPKSGDFEDHIRAREGSNPYVFGKNETVTFQITVKNTGDVTINDIDLEDLLPDFVKYRDGDGDSRDSGKKVRFDIGDLEPGEEETVEFRAKIADDTILPKDDMICLTNIAKAEGERKSHKDRDNKKEEGSDYANFCIDLPDRNDRKVSKEKPKVLPKTGGISTNVFATSVGVGFILVAYGLKKLTE